MKTTLWMAAMVSVVCVMTVSGEDKTWQGASGGNWTTTGNWIGGVPANDTTTDRAVFTTDSSGSVNVDASRSVGGLVIQRDIAFAGQQLTYSSPMLVNAACSVTFSNALYTGASMGDGSTLTYLNSVYSGGTFNMTNATINFKSQISFWSSANFYGSGRVNYASTYTNPQNLDLVFNDNVVLAYTSQASEPVNNNDAYFRFKGTNTLLLEKDANLTVSNSASIGGINGPMVLWNSTTTTVSGAHALTISQLNVLEGKTATLMLDGATVNIGDGGGVAEGVYSVSAGGGAYDGEADTLILAATTNGGMMRVRSSTLGSNFNPTGGGKGGTIIVDTNAMLISNCVWTNRDFVGYGTTPGLTVNRGATLGGTGAFVMAKTGVASEGLKNTVISGHVAPGDGGIGTLTISCSNLTWNSVSTNDSKWVWDLGNGNAADKLYIDGVFTKGTAGAGKFFFDLHNATRPGTFVLVEWTSNTTFGVSDFAVLNGSGNDTFSIVGKQLLLAVPARGTSIIIK